MGGQGENNDEKKPIKVVDVGVYEKIIIDLEWLEENNYCELKLTGQFYDDGLTVLSLNGEILELEEFILVPFFSDEYGCEETEAIVDYLKEEEIFKIHVFHHDDRIQSKIVYAKRIPKDLQK